jgi:putative membrane protein insertion efficiency factor
MSTPGNTGNVLLRGLAAALILLVRLYQLTLGPLLGLIGVQCRYQPTCSHYFIGAVEKYGAIRGAWRGLLRLTRCHPFHPGGYDPP